MNPEASDYADSGQPNNFGTPPPLHGYAGFWKRYAAALIDLVIIGVLWLGIGLFVGIVCDGAANPVPIVFIGTAISVIIAWLYFALFESSPNQATPGKMAVGIKVTDMDGNRISFGKASGRHFGKILSVLTVLVGYIMAAFTQKKQGLHDIVSGCLVVNKSKRSGCVVAIIICATLAVPALGILNAALFPEISNATLQANMTAMGMRAKDIYVAISAANTEREPLGLPPVWPKTGEQTEAGDDLAQMTFKNSTDYFNALYDAEQCKIQGWNEQGYSHSVTYGFDLSKCAGAGVPRVPEGGRLTAENNAWIIAANIREEMEDIIPILVSRNVDPASLIPRDGDLRKQFLRPSKEFKTPFGDKGFVLVRKGGAIYKGSWRYASLDIIYPSANREGNQAIRDAFQKVEYLAP